MLILSQRALCYGNIWPRFQPTTDNIQEKHKRIEHANKALYSIYLGKYTTYNITEKNVKTYV